MSSVYYKRVSPKSSVLIIIITINSTHNDIFSVSIILTKEGTADNSSGVLFTLEFELCMTTKWIGLINSLIAVCVNYSLVYLMINYKSSEWKKNNYTKPLHCYCSWCLKLFSNIGLNTSHVVRQGVVVNPQRACAEGYSSQLCLCVCVCLSDASNAC